ncbi:phosphoadenylyl-sulfate reductase [Parasediminibacterium sp. JCM 36343]|uniref:phosphoadenylyl-sulfate reductase n=1 Tax=Parasediminibacterium sp. JCM 36343 TaxID=3374279 RepID=UPI00397D6E96
MAVAGENSIEGLLHKIDGLSIKEVLELFVSDFPGKVTFSSSFSFEDQFISHEILSNQLPISIFTLDTGRLFSETYSVWSSTNERYQTHIKPYYPQHEALETFVSENGPNAFYESVENRKACCFIRKVEPLKRALAGNSIWVTGLRAEHSPDRHNLEILEWDEGNKVIKYHPLLHYTTEQVKENITKHNIPYNPLHDRGFVSIGCLPCTRAVRPGEDFRAGRWWWENAAKKECGLHVHN